MNKKLFFDMGSDNTFKEYNFLDWDIRPVSMYDPKIEKVIIWPKWLTLPEHYQSKDRSSKLYSFEFLYEYYLSHSR